MAEYLTRPEDSDVPDEPADDEAPRDPTPDEMMRECVAIEHEKREWLKSAIEFLAARYDADNSGRVQFASDQAKVAAYEAVSRLMNQVHPHRPSDALG
jgi:hypothetical protein